MALVDPAGPACHTGERSCFYRELGGSAATEVDAEPAEGEPAPAAHEALASLERTLRSRKAERPQGSYTVTLLDDADLLASKVAEEAEEVTRAGREESEQRVAKEAADLLYHLSVLMASRGVSQAEVLEVLNGLATELAGLDPDLSGARELAEQGNVVPVRMRLVDDCETPVSALLKLRGAGPCFLLESAEQGQVWGAGPFSASARGRCCAGAMACSRSGPVTAPTAALPTN